MLVVVVDVDDDDDDDATIVSTIVSTVRFLSSSCFCVLLVLLAHLFSSALYCIRRFALKVALVGRNFGCTCLWCLRVVGGQTGVVKGPLRALLAGKK